MARAELEVKQSGTLVRFSKLVFVCLIIKRKNFLGASFLLARRRIVCIGHIGASNHSSSTVRSARVAVKVRW